MSVAYKFVQVFKIILWLPSFFTFGKNTRNVNPVLLSAFTMTVLLLSFSISEFVILISSFERGKLLQQCWKGISLKSNLSPFFENIKYESITGVFFPVFIVLC